MILLRALRYLILLLLAITVIRSVLGFLARMFLNATAGPERREREASNPSGKPGKPQPTEPESLKKDPVCGTFVAPSTALTKEKGGRTHYFCSKECRDKY